MLLLLQHCALQFYCVMLCYRVICCGLVYVRLFFSSACPSQVSVLPKQLNMGYYNQRLYDSLRTL